MLSIISNSKKFFYLSDASLRFSFDNQNLLKDTDSITYKFALKNKFRRGVANNLLRVNRSQKFEIELRGCGRIPQLSMNEYSFVSGMMTIPYSNDNARKIAFDYLFKEGNSPEDDMNANLQEYANANDMFCMPEIICVVKSQKIKSSSWVLKLEEV